MYKLYCDKSELSIGQLFLLEFCDKRKVTELWNTQLNNQFSVSYIMKVATGKFKTPSLKFIYAMIKLLSPTDWFYQETEGNKSEHIPEEQITTDIRQSVNYKKLERLHQEKKLPQFCRDNFNERSQHTYVNLSHILNNRNSVSPLLISELREFFDIADWFKIAEK